MMLSKIIHGDCLEVLPKLPDNCIDSIVTDPPYGLSFMGKLITPPNGRVLDMFCGSGSTGKAALQEGFRFIGIEKEKEYVEIAKARTMQYKRKEKNELQSVV
jgi:DNA modification methylase